MIETRPILPSEAEEFLSLLCGVFELDIDRARGVFFAEPLFDLRRKWGLFDTGKLETILTTVPLHFGWGGAVGIAGVATRPEARRRGHAERLLHKVVQASRDAGESALFLFANQIELYERVGFRVLDEVVTGPLPATQSDGSESLLGYDDVRELYDVWSLQDPNRLRRDDKRWEYWRWNLRVCQRAPGGYFCVDGHVVREAVCDFGLPEWHCRPGELWCGLASMSERLGVPSVVSPIGTCLMGIGREAPPAMFMTDQF